jgi:hypothetical protein
MNNATVSDTEVSFAARSIPPFRAALLQLRAGRIIGLEGSGDRMDER